MFAVIEIGGRQYKVSPNEKIEVELLETEAGKTMKFDKVLLVSADDKAAEIGMPYLKGANVEAKVIEHFKGDKIRVFKFTPKKRYKKTQGHRQNYTRLEIVGINA
jgi:large subunit ribosomal protein L21